MLLHQGLFFAGKCMMPGEMLVWTKIEECAWHGNRYTTSRQTSFLWGTKQVIIIKVD